MDRAISLILCLRRVLESAGAGRGIAGSVVLDLRELPQGREAARLVLLGHSFRDALDSIRAETPEASTLVSLIGSAQGSSIAAISANGGALSVSVEKWLKARESARLQSRVMAFRGVVASGVMGAVSAMLASIGPIVGSLDLMGTGMHPDPTGLAVAAAAMAATGSGFLGAFIHRKSLYIDVAVSLAAFTLVSIAFAPLASVTPLAPWGVK